MRAEDGRSNTEVELSFAVNSADVFRLVRLLCSASAEWTPTAGRAKRRAPRTALHFYLQPTDSRDIRRIRVKSRRGSLEISLESKKVLSQDTFLAKKDERTDAAGMSLGAVRAIMSEPGSVISSFIKNQYRVFFGSDVSAFKASLDQVVPIVPGAEISTAPPVWHFELEEKINWRPDEFFRSRFFRAELAPYLRPLAESKWELARMGDPANVSMPTAKAMGAYLDSLFIQATRRRPSWHALSLPSSPGNDLER
jgi:hypothetical protein